MLTWQSVKTSHFNNKSNAFVLPTSRPPFSPQMHGMYTYGIGVFEKHALSCALIGIGSHTPYRRATIRHQHTSEIGRWMNLDTVWSLRQIQFIEASCVFSFRAMASNGMAVTVVFVAAWNDWWLTLTKWQICDIRVVSIISVIKLNGYWTNVLQYDYLILLIRWLLFPLIHRTHQSHAHTHAIYFSTFFDSISDDCHTMPCEKTRRLDEHYGSRKMAVNLKRPSLNGSFNEIK